MMSYCRCGDDSDVYVYNTWVSDDVPEGDTVIMIHVCYTAKPIDIGIAGTQYTYKTDGWALNRLLKLREMGLKVPRRALKRLRQQISGEWYQ